MTTATFPAGSVLARAARRGGPLLWYAALAGIGWWLVHLTTNAALVRAACNGGRTITWVMHGVTAATGLLTLHAAWLCYRLIRMAAGAGEGDASMPGRTRFLGWFGLMTNVISLALILLEGAYVLAIGPCGRP